LVVAGNPQHSQLIDTPLSSPPLLSYLILLWVTLTSNEKGLCYLILTNLLHVVALFANKVIFWVFQSTWTFSSWFEELQMVQSTGCHQVNQYNILKTIQTFRSFKSVLWLT
jgi:hypothetical protein